MPVQPVPEEFAASRALQFVVSKGWSWKQATGDQIQIENCPFCKKGDFKFYMGVSGDPQNSRDGLYFCHHGSCQTTGNLRTLAERTGDRIANVITKEEVIGARTKQDPLPDVEACHAALLANAEAMDYLVNVRGFSEDVIKKMKLGLKEGVYFREAGKRTALVYPYLVQGCIVFAKFRTMPPAPKDFTCPSGYDVGLYNGDVLQEGLKEIIFVEGEANTVAMLSLGIQNVVGVPGASMKKATWIELLDQVAPKDIYIMYDSYDKAGDRGSQELASRIGFDKEPRKIVLPKFEVTVPQDECKVCNGTGAVQGNPCEHKRLGKDFNEWITKGGGSLEKFEEIKLHSKKFDVTGVTSAPDALGLLEEELRGKKDLAPTYTMKNWPSLSRLVGFENGDVIDILAPEKVGKTTFGLNLLDDMVEEYKEDALLICLEMTQARLARKWVSKLTGFEDIICQPGTPEAAKKLTELLECVDKAREMVQNRIGELYFAYPKEVKEPEDIFRLIRDCVRRYNVKWVMFDNLQRLCDDTLKNQGHRTTHLSQISKGLTKIAKDNNIKMIRILQPHRIGDNEIIRVGDVDGSSQTNKDCDCLMTMWRKRIGEVNKREWEKKPMMEDDGTFDPRCRIQVGLSRYSSGGSCDLWFDGPRSQVREINPDQKTAMLAQQAQVFNTMIPQEDGSMKNVAITEEKLTATVIPTEGNVTQPVKQETEI